MEALTPAAVLTIWEEGEPRHPIDQALLPLAASLPDWSWDELVALPVGRRDGLLLRLRAATLGPRLEMLVACPSCRELMEFDAEIDELTVTDALALPPDPPPIAGASGEQRMRLLDSRDLADAVRVERTAARVLLAGRAAEGMASAAVATALAEADPQADLLFTLDCPACSHGWTASFDIADFFWREISALAKRLLDEVQELARHYGWSESAVITMSPARRRHYLERARA